MQWPQRVKGRDAVAAIQWPQRVKGRDAVASTRESHALKATPQALIP